VLCGTNEVDLGGSSVDTDSYETEREQWRIQWFISKLAAKTREKHPLFMSGFLVG
jgi:hypothetical protein